MKFKRKNTGTCSSSTEVEIENGIITAVRINGGCSGNSLGLAAMCVGKAPDEVIERLSGIRCGMKQTSCPDQLAKALEAAVQQSEK